jgi:hypothetical protein
VPARCRPALVALVAAASLAPFAAAEHTGRLVVVARDLNNPRKLFLAPGRALYVAEAGAGGRDKCRGSGATEACIGLTGSITEVAGGTQRRVVVGLASVATLDEQRAAGPADVLLRDGRYDVLLQDTEMDARGDNGLGRDGKTLGALISTPPGLAAPHVIARLAAFEAAHNPDHGAGPGRAYGNPPIDSDPYAFTAYRRGFAAVDAAGNDLLWISPRGAVSVLAVFPTQTVRLTAAERKRFGIAPSVRSLVVQSVPSSVIVGPDGALYVGELTGVPFRRGAARVWRVVPGRKPTLFASGFTNISDLAFLGRSLLVLEISSAGLSSPSSAGALIRVAPGGRRTVLAGKGLVAPTGLAVGGHTIYISNHGTSPGAGPGPHGEVVRLTVSAGSG